MDAKRSSSEELVFRTAQLDAAMQEAGFHLAFSDPEASRDFGYRARYVRGRSTLFPLLHASLEYYLASRSYSLKISAGGDGDDNRTYACLVKNYRGDLKDLLEQYFDSMRRGVPLMVQERRGP
ncbi:MAG: hypothetical protein ACYC7L_06540 [Nitrospirota bacterium]